MINLTPAHPPDQLDLKISRVTQKETFWAGLKIKKNSFLFSKKLNETFLSIFHFLNSPIRYVEKKLKEKQ